VTAAEQVAGRPGLLEQLMAVVRPEFRAEVYVPDPGDPVFAAGECAVAGCDRTAVSTRHRLCNAHAIRFRDRGRPPMEEFLADPGPPVRGRGPLAEPGTKLWPPVLGLFRSAVAALTYMRRNRVQAEIAESFGVSQPTVSRAVSAMTSIIRKVLAP
jgi:hypothetical protein